MKKVGKFGMSDQTLLNPGEAEGLIPYIAYKWQLDELERDNIVKAKRWMSTSRKLKEDYPKDYSLKLLHKKMFGDVWTWAGEYRTTEKNIGNVLSFQVHEELRKLCDDIKYQLTPKKVDIADIAIRFHHRLTCIHPFPNGNGRFAREATDLLLKYNGQKVFAWGIDKNDQDKVRQEYITSLRSADTGNLTPLSKFLRN